HAGDVGVEHEAVGLLLDVDARRPLAAHHRGFVAAGFAEQAALEQALEQLAHGLLNARPSASHAADLVHPGLLCKPGRVPGPAHRSMCGPPAFQGPANGTCLATIM